MRIITSICLALAICVCIPVKELLAEELPIEGSLELIVPKSSQEMVDPNAEAAKQWYRYGEPQGNKGELWEQGTSAEEINRRRIPSKNNTQGDASLDTRAGIQVQLKNLSDYAREANSEPITLGDGKIEGRADVGKATWKPSVAEPIKIDEPILSSQHSVVGAYAQMVDDDDFKISAGPEIHLPESIDSPLGSSSERPDSSEIGMGMKLMWGF